MCCKCERGCFPNGKWLIFPMVTSIVAFFFSVAVLATCKFAILKVDDTNIDSRIGLFRYEDRWDDCESYSSEQKDAILDGAFKSARAFGAIACALGFVAMILSFVPAGAALDMTFYRIHGAILGLCSLSTVLTFTMFATDICSWEEEIDDDNLPAFGSNTSASTSCDLGPGGAVAIAASLLWFGAAVCCFLAPRPAKARDSQPSPTMVVEASQTVSTTAQQVPPPAQTYTTTVLADGARVITAQPPPAQATQTTYVTKKHLEDGTMITETVTSYGP